MEEESVYVSIEAAYEKIANWMLYVHEEKVFNKLNQPTLHRKVTLYKDAEITYEKDLIMKGIVEIFYYISTESRM